MARDEDDDLFDEEFDFVDEDEEEVDESSDLADETDYEDQSADHRAPAGARYGGERAADDERVDEYGRPEPKADYVVHIYEHQKFKRTIDRPFTAEDAEAFATEYNRTAKPYHRVAVAGKNDTKPKKTLSE